MIRKAINGRRAIASRSVGDCLRVADQKLQQLRDEFKQNLGQSIIQHSGGLLQIPSPLQSSLSALRNDAVAAVNDALKLAGLQPV